ncbi:MAG: glycoside hydrolase family 3 protein [Ruminococcus sp.]|nr:glycoside hydrolase family 3 protein [Ruminococcus sp.]
MNNKRKLLAASILAGMIMTLTACGEPVDKLKPKMTTRSESSSVAEEASSQDAQPADSKADESKADDSSKADGGKKQEKKEDTKKDDKAPDKKSNKKTADTVFADMTLDEKIGQLFIVTPEQIDGYDETVTMYDDTMSELIAKYPVGGIIQMTANVTDPEQITELNKKLQGISKYGLFIAVDEEGGQVARIGLNENFDVPRYNSMYEIGSTGDTANAKEVGKTIGGYVKGYGFNVDFAPDADVYTNPENTVIGDRAFSSDPQVASDMVGACIEGFHESGIITSIKHFPGHGDTYEDTHTSGAVVNKSWDDLLNCELMPFINNLDKTDMIMISHITLPNVTSDGMPASLSRELITDKLKGDLGFKGIVITDSLSMQAVSNDYTPGQAAVKAFSAGADILLMPGNIGEAMDGIKEALSDGTLSEERLNESVMKILKLKEKYGIL